MKIIKIDENTISIKLSLGRVDIKDNLYNAKEKAVAIAINSNWDVKIKGIGGKMIILKEKNKFGKIKDNLENDFKEK
ncbi:MAG: hypothetical protein ACFE9S_07495 [Candidatus Hermodarchaeota archaeon]